MSGIPWAQGLLRELRGRSQRTLRFKIWIRLKVENPDFQGKPYTLSTLKKSATRLTHARGEDVIDNS